MKKNTLLFILLICISPFAFAQSTVTYSVVFESNWSQSAHPHSSGNLPSNAHWSKLVGATHNDQVTFLEMGELATEGIKNIAELGSNTAFFNEVDAAIAKNNANQQISGPSLGTGLGQMVINSIETTEDFPLLTLASMIAPSPDWMIAVNGIELLDGNGAWKESIVLDLYPYDAGTDSGTDYTSANSVTNPQQPIVSGQGVAPFSNEKIGTLTVTLEGVLGSQDVQKTRLQLFPNPTQGTLNISNGVGINKVEVYNVLGKLILNKNRVSSKSTTVNLDTYPNGVYLVKITDSNNQQTTKKVIKQ